MSVEVSMKLSPKATGKLYMRNIALEKRVTELHNALAEAHRILLHEMGNGRTPTMLQGVGLGYFEDVLAGLPASYKENK